MRSGIVHSVCSPTIPAFYMEKICPILNIGSLHDHGIHRRNTGHGPPDRPLVGAFLRLADSPAGDVFPFVTDPTGGISRTNSSNSLLRDRSDITFRRAPTASSTFHMRSSLSAKLCIALWGDSFNAGITLSTLYCNRAEPHVAGGGLSSVG